jgi:hypothetical protein
VDRQRRRRGCPSIGGRWFYVPPLPVGNGRKKAMPPDDGFQLKKGIFTTVPLVVPLTLSFTICSVIPLDYTFVLSFAILSRFHPFSTICDMWAPQHSQLIQRKKKKPNSFCVAAASAFRAAALHPTLPPPLHPAPPLTNLGVVPSSHSSRHCPIRLQLPALSPSAADRYLCLCPHRGPVPSARTVIWHRLLPTRPLAWSARLIDAPAAGFIRRRSTPPRRDIVRPR